MQRSLRIALLIGASVFCARPLMLGRYVSTPMQSTEHFSYDEYDRLTRAYVDQRGGVNYPGLKKTWRRSKIS